MKWYPWLRPPFEQLVASYQAGRGHHALMVQALPGMGSDALIYALCRFLMCRQPEGHKSCGHCHSCQLMQAGTHPDYYALTPEKGKSSLGIDAVREVSEKLYEHARLGGAKVVWIGDAAMLTDAAANALLKTLEEPPENTWFFLACQEPARLLANAAQPLSFVSPCSAFRTLRAGVVRAGSDDVTRRAARGAAAERQRASGSAGSAAGFSLGTAPAALSDPG